MKILFGKFLFVFCLSICLLYSLNFFLVKNEYSKVVYKIDEQIEVSTEIPVLKVSQN